MKPSKTSRSNKKSNYDEESEGRGEEVDEDDDLPGIEDANETTNPSQEANGTTNGSGIHLKDLALVAGAGIVGAAATAVLAPVALTALGFGGVGITAGSIAASWMSLYGAAVPAGGLFATLQSAGMAGIAASTPGVAGVASAATVGVARLFFGRNKDEAEEQGDAPPVEGQGWGSGWGPGGAVGDCAEEGIGVEEEGTTEDENDGENERKEAQEHEERDQDFRLKVKGDTVSPTKEA